MTSKPIYLSMHGAYLFTPSSETFDHGPGQAHGKGGLGATVRPGYGIARTVWSHGVAIGVAGTSGSSARGEIKESMKNNGEQEGERRKEDDGRKEKRRWIGSLSISGNAGFAPS